MFILGFLLVAGWHNRQYVLYLMLAFISFKSTYYKTRENVFINKDKEMEDLKFILVHLQITSEHFVRVQV